MRNLLPEKLNNLFENGTKNEILDLSRSPKKKSGIMHCSSVETLDINHCAVKKNF